MTRKFHPGIVSVKSTDTVTPVQIAAANNERTAITFSGWDQTLKIATDKNFTNCLLRLSPGQPPLEFCQCHHGNFVKGEFWMLGVTGTVYVTIIEGFEPWPSNE